MYARGGALHGVCDVIVALAVVAAATAVVDDDGRRAGDRSERVASQEAEQKYSRKYIKFLMCQCAKMLMC